MNCSHSDARDCSECLEAYCPYLDDFYPERPQTGFDWRNDWEEEDGDCPDR